jgi:TonB-dependent receptor
MNRRLMGTSPRALLALVAFALLSPPTGAQERLGGIRGHIADESNNPLPGASVRVDPSGAGAVSDRDGNFLLSSVAPGTAKIVVSCLGFTTQTQQVTVGAGEQTKVEVKLRPSVNVSEVVEVTASRSRGEVESLNQQKTAMNILDVLPAEIITSLPNKNVAEAIGRLPSVSLERDEGEGKYVQVRGLESRYTNMTINGAHIPPSEAFGRQLKLDAIPSDLVGSIELHKTISPDQDGDAIGGSVNLVTKTAGDTPTFSLGLDGGEAFLQGGRYNYQATSTYTSRFGADKRLGLVIGGTYDWNGRAINDVEPAPAVVTLPNGQDIAVFTGADYRDYRYDRSRYGVAGGLDYRLGPDSSLYLRGLFSEFHNYGQRWVTSVTAGNFLTPTTTDASGGFSGNTQHRNPNEQTYSLSAGGKHDLGAAFLDYNVSYSHARQDSAGYDTAFFNGPSAAFAVDSSNGFFPKFTALGGVNQLDATQYSFSDAQVENLHETHARDAAVAANVAVPYGLSAGTFKFGAKYRDERKENNIGDQFFNATGSPTLLGSQAIEPFNDPNYYFGFYPQGPNFNLGTSLSFLSTPGAAAADANRAHLRNDPNNWVANEKIAAVYAMNTYKWGSLELEGGVRAEHTSANYDGFQVTTKNGVWASTSPTSGGSTYTNVLPSVSLKYEADPNTNLRAVYGWAIQRPDYAELVPSIFLTDTRKQVTVGNPALKPTKGQSFDLLFEHYLGSVGVVSAGGFFKQLTDPIYATGTTIIDGGIFNGFTQIQPLNGPSAHIYGFEVAWQQHLGFLPGFLGGLGINANYTYTDSKATFDPRTGRTGSARLQRTTPNEFNLNLTYDKGPFSLRAALTYNDATIFFYQYTDGTPGGLTGPGGDTYLYPHTQIDAQANYAFKNGLIFFVSALNLNNEVFGFYNGSPQWNIQREFYGPEVSIGFKLNR